MIEQKPLDDVGGARELALYRLEVAKEDLAAAELSMSQQQYRSANNRAYYAIFHAISACLALEFKESLIKSIRASGERFFRLSRKRPRRRSIATSRGI